jgi:hypothetical protein
LAFKSDIVDTEATQLHLDEILAPAGPRGNALIRQSAVSSAD